jgi:hypothetical protein
LSATAPTCIYQNISNLDKGLYNYTIKYKARTDFIVQGNFAIYFNGLKLRYVVAVDDKIHIVQNFVNISQSLSTAQLKICG